MIVPLCLSKGSFCSSLLNSLSIDSLIEAIDSSMLCKVRSTVDLISSTEEAPFLCIGIMDCLLGCCELDVGRS